ncbi:hypothetical protein LCGC14_1518790 [marine sediment metagenome]|uniref:Uncharacterized protein n=1 Tax=marine sediment metagenome TaxID=412755 RepID=A0A0F9JK27_9ZZZZ
MFNNISGAQLEFIIIQRFIYGVKPGPLFDMLTDPKAYDKYGVQPIPSLNKNYFYKCLKLRIPKTTIERVTVEWSLDILSEPLARGRSRIIALTEIVKSDNCPPQTKVSAIKAIGDISGEDDALIKALAKSGNAKVEITLQDKLLKKYDEVEESLEGSGNESTVN